MKIRNLQVLAVVLLLIVTLASCKKKPPPPPPPPPTPTAAAVPAPTVDINATPPAIERGQSTTLEWKSENANTLTLEPGLGQVPPSGTLNVSPFESTTYRITARGPGGTADDSVRITVNPRPVPPEPPGPAEEDITQVFAAQVRDIFFDYDRYEIRSDAVNTLQNNAEFLRRFPRANIVIEGHADERGSTEYNLGLSDRRAQSAKDYLVSLGIEASRIRTVPYGEERPFCFEQNETCWQMNRRGHFTLAR